MAKTIVAICVAVFLNCIAGDAHAAGTQTHSFNGGKLVLSTVDDGFPAGDVTQARYTDNGGLPPGDDISQLTGDGALSDDLTDPYTFFTWDQKIVIWQTNDSEGVRWWIACWHKPHWGPYALLWTKELSHD